MPPDLPAPDEADRLRALHGLGALDVPPNPELDALTRLAARLCGMPAAILSVLDEDWLRLTAIHGIERCDLTHASAVCIRALLTPEQPMIVVDARRDHRLADLMGASDTPRFLAYVALPLLSATGHPLGTLCVADDRPRRLAAARIAALGDLAEVATGLLHAPATVDDPPTGLSDAASFLHRLEAELRQRRGGRGIAVLRFRLTDFTRVAATLPLPMAEGLLRRAAGRLAGSLRPGDLAAWLGNAECGDAEFAVLLPNVADAAEAATTRQRLLKLLALPYNLGERFVRLPAASGIALFPADGAGARALLAQAEPGLASAPNIAPAPAAPLPRKPPGGTSAAPPIVPRALALDLRLALTEDLLRLSWQPFVDLGTGLPAGRHATLLWHRPIQGDLPAAAFEAQAAAAGLAAELDAWALRHACTQAARWPDDRLLATVPVSAACVQAGMLPTLVESALATSGLVPQRLELIVTGEALHPDAGLASAALTELRQLGVRIVLEGLGSGRASLADLRRLPLDKVRLEPGFTLAIEHDPRAREVLRTVLGLCHTLGLAVLADGIEQPPQLADLRELGCDQAQGAAIGATIT